MKNLMIVIAISMAMAGGSWAGSCESTLVYFDMVDLTPLTHTGQGDDEMKGHNPSIEISATLKRHGTRLEIAGKVIMEEDRPDYTKFEKSFRRSVFVPELQSPDCRLGSLTPERGHLSANGGQDNHAWTWYDGDGLIERAQCRSDTKGRESGRLGCRIYFNPVVVNLVD